LQASLSHARMHTEMCYIPVRGLRHRIVLNSDLFFGGVLIVVSQCCIGMRTEGFPTIFKLHVTMSSINALWHRLYALVDIHFLCFVFFSCGLSLHALLS